MGGPQWRLRSTGLAVVAAVALAAAVALFGWGFPEVLTGLQPGLLLFSRHSDDAIVSHHARRLVLDVVAQNPNINMHTLTRLCGLHKSVVRYHARVLESGGFVRSHKVHRDRCFVSRQFLEIEGRGALAPTADLVARNDPVVAVIVAAVPPQGVRLAELLDRVRTDTGLSKVGAWKAVVRAQFKGGVRLERAPGQVWVHHHAP